MEDDHVDRPGVEAPQGVELTGTNSSIGLIALINAMLILALRPRVRAATREPAWRVVLRGRRASGALMMGGENSPVEMPDQFAFTLLSTWWLLRGGCTRSHSELGRETPQRRWYSVSRRGRVGRCQVCQRVKSASRSLLHNAFQTAVALQRRPFGVFGACASVARPVVSAWGTH